VTDKIEQLRAWIREEHRRRTDLLDAGNGRIEWIDPGTRVGFSEACAKAEELGIEADVVSLRLALNGWEQTA
jgi:hypothetical protein